MIEFKTDSMVKMDKALKPFIQSIDEKLKNFQPVSKEIINQDTMD